MRNNSTKNKSISEEQKNINRLCANLADIREKSARFALACEIAKDSQEYDIGV